eukprot:CAMPEP_0179375200 /NCGR_PEP_ID=MMETSP0797-20121207/87685_1 /TAXON_ID=47934 /ORGANISM="Dinophysis acuminata, Strain DAEP01" /LENGTH=203 /DNA_ID=CAMNT_0021091209 /DNA_START=68 /DNA_END=675 /DNA_ORIENTATION=+
MCGKTVPQSSAPSGRDAEQRIGVCAHTNLPSERVLGKSRGYAVPGRHGPGCERFMRNPDSAIASAGSGDTTYTPAAAYSYMLLSVHILINLEEASNRIRRWSLSDHAFITSATADCVSPSRGCPQLPGAARGPERTVGHPLSGDSARPSAPFRRPPAEVVDRDAPAPDGGGASRGDVSAGAPRGPPHAPTSAAAPAGSASSAS